MPLVALNLDDISWRELVDGAIDRIPANSDGQWTHHSPVDAGVSILELYSHLLEQRFYWLNRTTDQEKFAFLRLLGEAPGPADVASTVFAVREMRDPVPEGIPEIDAETILRIGQTGPLTFSTEHSITALPINELEVSVGGKDKTNDLVEGRPIPLNGPGQSVLELQVVFWLARPLPPTVPEAPISLFVEFANTAGIPDQWSDGPENHVASAARLRWWHSAEFGPEEFEQSHVMDGTRGLRRNGLWRLRIPDTWHPLAATDPNKGTPYGIMLSADLTDVTFPPVLRRMEANAAIASHRRRTELPSDNLEKQVRRWNKLPRQRLDLPADQQPPLRRVPDWRVDADRPSAAQRYRRLDLVKVSNSNELIISPRRQSDQGGETAPDLWAEPLIGLRERDGNVRLWRPTDDFSLHGPSDRVFNLNRDAGYLEFGDGINGRIPVPGFGAIADDEISHAYGLVFDLKWSGNAPQTFVRSRLSGSTLRLLTDWDESGAASEPLVAAVVTDLNRLLEDPQLCDSNLFKGIPLSTDIPKKGPTGLSVAELAIVNRQLLEAIWPEYLTRFPGVHLALYYQVGGGLAGNIPARAHSSWDWVPDSTSAAPARFEATPLVAGTGGAESETLEEALARASSNLRRRERAITVDDIVELATSTPRAAIRRAEVIFGQHPDFPCTTVPGAISVFVVPYAPRGSDTDVRSPEFVPAPVADDGVLAAVQQRLDDRSLVTTEIFARKTPYRAVSIRVRLATSADSDVDFRRLIGVILGRYLDPLVGGDRGNGWPFGGPLRPSSLLRILQDHIGDLADVQRIGIQLAGASHEEDCRDVEIKNNELVFLDSVKVELSGLPAAAQSGLR